MIMVANDSGNIKKGSRPVHLGDWVQANRPKLHPTRRKVLAGVANLSQEDSWTSSTEVRQQVSISQQLLNRHLRALEAEGLVLLEKQGPGLPLSVQITSAGLRALGLRGPRPAQASGQEPQVTVEQAAPSSDFGQGPDINESLAAAQSVVPEALRKPPVQISSKAYEFLERLYKVLAPFLKGVDRRDYYYLTAPAMHQRPVVGALFAALSQYLPGLRAVEFKEIVASLTGVQPKPASQVKASQQLPSRQASLASGSAPPKLSPAEEALEGQLARVMNPEYRGMEWHQRTRLLSDEWDRTRRRRMGLFRTTFTSFGPRWQRPDWSDFNQARRQADHRGADYAEWVAVQFDRLAPEGEREVKPLELHGELAVAAYLDYRRGEDGERGRELGAPPYTAQSFNAQDPSHLEYAQRLISETATLAEHIMGGDPQGPARLLAQAVRSGALPLAALDLAPLHRQEVLAILQNDASQYQQPRPAAGPQPKVII